MFENKTKRKRLNSITIELSLFTIDCDPEIIPLLKNLWFTTNTNKSKSHKCLFIKILEVYQSSNLNILSINVHFSAEALPGLTI